MKRRASRSKTTAAWVLLFTLAAPLACGDKKDADDPSDTDTKAERIPRVDETIALFKEKDPTLEKFFSTAAGYVVFPSVGKGGLIVGGAKGEGDAFHHGAYVGMVIVRELSVGAQVGGQNFAEIVFFEKDADFKELTDGTFEFKAEVSAIAAKKGTAQNSAFSDGVAAFVIPKKGLMASAAIGGQKLSYYPAK